MSENLFKAVFTLYSTTNDFHTATHGRFDYSKGNDRWNDNYAIIQGLDKQKDDLFRTTLDDLYFQINLFSTTRSGSWSLLEKCIALFDNSTVTVTGHYPARITRETQVLPIWNEQDNLYQATAEFRCKLQPT